MGSTIVKAVYRTMTKLSSHLLSVIHNNILRSEAKGGKWSHWKKCKVTIYQAWPKWGPRAACGPSTYFWGPPIFLSFIKTQIYLNILYQYATKMTNVETKFKKFKKFRPSVKEDLRIWPASKKVWPPLLYIYYN